MTRWVLLLRAVNVGGNNKLSMADLKSVLEDLGHRDVKTYLNSGNATFVSSRTSAKSLSDEVETGLREGVALDVRACVRRASEIAALLDDLPDLPGYVACTILFDKPKAAALKGFLETDWSPEVVQGNGQVLYIGFKDAGRTKLTNVKIEKSLGVGATARTPATLRKLLS